MNKYRVTFMIIAEHIIEAEDSSAAEDEALWLCQPGRQVVVVEGENFKVDYMRISGTGEVNEHDNVDYVWDDEDEDDDE